MHRNTPKSVTLGALLRNVRERRNLSQRQLAKYIDVNHAMLSRNETGERSPTRDEVTVILDGLEITGTEREQILALARDTSGSPLHVIKLLERRVQLAVLLEVEDMAEDVVNWSPLILPGLLQVSGYTRAIMEAGGVPDEEIATRVAIRMGRRDILVRRNPVRYTALVGEAVLSQTIVGPRVMTEQLDHLLIMGARPNVDLRIVPTATGWHPGLSGPFTLLANGATTFLHMENLVTSTFVQEDDAVATFEKCVPQLSDIAMGPEESAELIARQADRMRGSDDRAVEEVQQEQCRHGVRRGCEPPGRGAGQQEP